MQTLNQKQHVVISLSIALIVVGALFAIFVSPAITDRIKFNDRFEELQFQYSKFEQTIQQSESLKMELEQLKNIQTDQAGFLEEKAEALAAADLQKRIKTVIDGNGGNLISTQVVKNRTETVFPSVTIKVHVRSDIESLQKLLYQFASNDTVLIIDNLLVQKRRQGGSRRARRDANLLEIRFDITGFIYQSSIS